MNFNPSMAKKYANIRTFKPEDGAGGGAGEGEGGEAAAADAAADAEKAKAQASDAEKAKDGGQAAAQPPGKTVAELEAELAAERAEKARLLTESMSRKEKLKGFEGVDVEKYQKLLAAEQEAERKAAEAAGDFERVKQMMADSHKAEREALEARIAELQDKASSQAEIVDRLTIGNAFGSSTFIADKMILSPAKTRVLYGAHFEIENGAVVAYNKPRGSEGRTQLVDGSGAPLGFDAALERIIEADPDKKTVLRSRARSGAGSGSAASDRADPPVPPNDDLYGASRIAASLAKAG